MTTIFELGQSDEYRALVQVDADGEVADEDSAAIRSTWRCGVPFGDDHAAISLSWGAPKRKQSSDIHAMLVPFLVFSRRAQEVLEPYLKKAGHEVPVCAPVPNYSGFHVSRVLKDAVDMSASKLQVYPSATVFSRVVLLERGVQGADMFRLKERPSSVFVSRNFKAAAEQSGLRGFKFSPANVSRG